MRQSRGLAIVQFAAAMFGLNAGGSHYNYNALDRNQKRVMNDRFGNTGFQRAKSSFKQNKRRGL